MLSGAHPLLTAEAEAQLATRWRDHGDRRALDDLVRCNIRLAKFLASRWPRCGVSVEDLEQHAAIGLLRAARDFDPAYGVRFSSFAQHWIRHEIARAIHNSDLIRVPGHASEWKPQIFAACASLREAGEAISAESVWRWLSENTRRNQAPPSVTCIRSALEAWSGLVPIDAPVRARGGRQAYNGESKGFTYGDFIAAQIESPEDRLDAEARLDRACKSLDALPPTERLILYRRLVEGKTLVDSAEGLGIGGERVRQIETRALLQARSGVGREVASRATWERLGSQVEQAIACGCTDREAIRRRTLIAGSLLRDTLAWLLFERRIVVADGQLQLAEGERPATSNAVEWLDSTSAAKALGISRSHLIASFKRRIRNRRDPSQYRAPLMWLASDVERIAAARREVAGAIGA